METCQDCGLPLNEERIEVGIGFCYDCHPSMDWMIDEDEDDYWEHEDTEIG